MQLRRRKGAPGRPTKLTQEVSDTIVATVLVGGYYEVAAAKAGISTEVLHDWIRRGTRLSQGQGLKGDQPWHLEFAQRFRKAEAEFESKAVFEVYKIGLAGDGRLLLDLLARRHPSRWGSSQRLEHTGRGGGPMETVTVTELQARLKVAAANERED